MARTLSYIDELPAHVQANWRRWAERITLQPGGAARQIMRVLMAAPDDDFRMGDLVRQTRAPRNRINSARTRLELLGFITIRRDHTAPRLPGGAPPRWFRLTPAGRAVAVREGIAPADPTATPPTDPTTPGKPRS